MPYLLFTPYHLM